MPREYLKKATLTSTSDSSDTKEIVRGILDAIEAGGDDGLVLHLHRVGEGGEVGPAERLRGAPELVQEAEGEAWRDAVGEEDDGDQQTDEEPHEEGQGKHDEGDPEEHERQAQGGADPVEGPPARARPEPVRAVEPRAPAHRGVGSSDGADPGAHDDVDLDAALVEGLEDAGVVGPGRPSRSGHRQPVARRADRRIASSRTAVWSECGRQSIPVGAPGQQHHRLR